MGCDLGRLTGIASLGALFALRQGAADAVGSAQTSRPQPVQLGRGNRKLAPILNRAHAASRLDLSTFFCYSLPPTQGEKMTTQSTNDRLDRVERILEQLAERQERTDEQLNHLVEVTDRLIGRNAEQIGQLSNNMNFLRTALEGHLTDSKAHTAD